MGRRCWHVRMWGGFVFTAVPLLVCSGVVGGARCCVHQHAPTQSLPCCRVRFALHPKKKGAQSMAQCESQLGGRANGASLHLELGHIMCLAIPRGNCAACALRTALCFSSTAPVIVSSYPGWMWSCVPSPVVHCALFQVH